MGEVMADWLEHYHDVPPWEVEVETEPTLPDKFAVVISTHGVQFIKLDNWPDEDEEDDGRLDR